jgi:hypothetical protein
MDLACRVGKAKSTSGQDRNGVLLVVDVREVDFGGGGVNIGREVRVADLYNNMSARSSRLDAIRTRGRP